MHASKILKYFLILIALSSCSKDSNDRSLFSLLSPATTGVDFVNELLESDSLNVIAYDYMYNGAGVAVGDFNNDGLSDLFFAGNKVSSRLYLNDGEFKFKDITEMAGVTTTSWCEGVTLVDINNDGFLDIYISTSNGYRNKEEKNLLFVNQGVNEKGIPSFEEEAAIFGIDDTGYNTQAAFFDYDGDGHLDLYILANALENFPRNTSRPKKLSGEGSSTDKLFRNNGNGQFEDVSEEAGIKAEGYGLGVAISDINKDGWPDIYVANDFVTNDLLYMNNGDGTFTNAIATAMKHQSHNGMGADIADFNNDGLSDVIVLDMMPEDNLRQKTMFASVKYDQYKSYINYGYEPQFVRNTLQLNNGNGSFSEIAQLSGVYKTDWSWAPLFADFDNDGFKDLFITNGYGKDITDLDYTVYSISMNSFGTKESKIQKAREGIKNLIEVKKPNFIFKNNKDLTFTDKTESWGFEQPSLSNGTAFADLDNDGDLDLIVNNVNDPAFIYRNNSITKDDEKVAKTSNFLQLNLKGSSHNIQGIGSKITIYYSQGALLKQQYYEHFLTRGYKSSVDSRIHFGLCDVTKIDSLEVVWPDGKMQLVKGIDSNQTVDLLYKDATPPSKVHQKPSSLLFTDVSEEKYLKVKTESKEFVDFKVQSLLPHKHSENGPGIAVADCNGDGLEDFYLGGSVNFSGVIYSQNADGTFKAKQIPGETIYDDMGALFFDADNDGHVDLYVVSGGSRYEAGALNYQDRLYFNDGKGNFKQDKNALPEMLTSGSVVTAADFDQDGDLDLFIGGRVIPGQYPLPAKSFLLRNDSGKFTDITKQICSELEDIGLVTAAVWSDFDNDGLLDLIVTGEWMPLTVLKQKKSAENNIRFEIATETAGLGKTSGWWNSIIADDIDKDGDTDYIAGNLGLNTKYKCSEKEPVSMYAKDFNNNGSLDPLMFYYIQGEQYPAPLRDDLVSQLPHYRLRYAGYADYGRATFKSFFKEGELEDAYVLKNYVHETSLIENLGNGTFEIKPLPIEAQFSPVFGIISEDFNRDGHADLLLAGNSYATEVHTGRYDASIGIYLKGDGKGNYKAVSVKESGFFVDGDAKALASLRDTAGNNILLVSQHNDSLKVYKFENKNTRRLLTPEPLDHRVEIIYKDGTKINKELHHGASYLTQSSRDLVIDDKIISVTFYNYNGRSRTVSFADNAITKK